MNYFVLFPSIYNVYIVRRSTVSNVNPTGSARHRTIAVHYTGDTSKYVPVRHERYHGELINYILFPINFVYILFSVFVI